MKYYSVHNDNKKCLTILNLFILPKILKNSYNYFIKL